MVQRPGRRRRAAAVPYRLLLSMGLLFAGLLADAPAGVRATVPDLYLHATWYQGHGDRTYGNAVTTLGRPSQLVDTHIKGSRLYNQTTYLEVSDETRWGTLFSWEWTFDPHMRIPPGVTPQRMVLPLAGAEFPVGVLYTDQWACLFDESTSRDFPTGPVRLLAGHALGARHVDLLGLTEPPGGPREVHLWELTAAGLDQVSFGMPVAAGEVALAGPGPGRTFYLAAGRALWHVRHAGASGGPATVQTIPVPANLGLIRQLSATRVVSAADECPGAGDVVLLMAGNRVHVIPCAGQAEPVPGAGAAFTASLPAGASTAAGRLVTPPEAPSLQDTYPFLYFVQPGPGAEAGAMDLWRARVLPGELVWRRLVVPPGSRAPENLQLVRLQRSLAAAPAGEWALMADQRALLESGRFGCGIDGSIVCDGPGGLTGSSEGWACAENRVPGPYLVPGQLCAACAVGHYLDHPEGEAPFSSPGHVCRPCADSACHTCDASDCLVCKGSRVLQPSGPGGSMVCVSDCHGSYTRRAGVCLPTAMRLDRVQLGTIGRETLPGPVPETQVTGVGPTRLRVDPATGRPVIPPVGTEPGHVLLFPGPGQNPLIMDLADIGWSGKSPPVALRLFDTPPSYRVDFSTELGPMLDSTGHLVMGLGLFCSGIPM
ncbi:hypothetical protein H696_02534 [Fonticula alba]|uniref:Uncharacterized protein n=1 Tax=Fonticula alba TaxID=691883 RepID=A0A058ZCC0_FONAL|nr:hypothetical protein H696_02534 [Fonticula alba]KCV71591.1 hypothetical protein H696_02534 [Fonticula alba]|eukprot:XP_009494714.1 hypothetical protein H696_02534 [Fonticula alba]